MLWQNFFWLAMSPKSGKKLAESNCIWQLKILFGIVVKSWHKFGILKFFFGKKWRSCKQLCCPASQVIASTVL